MIDCALNRIKVKRGSQLPHSKLDEDDVRLILDIIDDRERLKKEASLLTNARLAEKFGVHKRTIDRISAGENWIHVCNQK